MKITRRQLRQLITEELNMLNESSRPTFNNDTIEEWTELIIARMDLQKKLYNKAKEAGLGEEFRLKTLSAAQQKKFVSNNRGLVDQYVSALTKVASHAGMKVIRGDKGMGRFSQRKMKKFFKYLDTQYPAGELTITDESDKILYSMKEQT